ncbi:N-acetylmuramoyl-L-alanine amidase [Puteibacter caeruleilacunae]|nr:N-acetylmuramoyl-L-alanine amidase [Puteibacter caeruleilacunae]
MKIVKHLLEGDGITQMVCKKNTAPLRSHSAIVIHYTAGGSGQQTALFLCRPEIKQSCNILIDRDASIYQLNNFVTTSWHAGKSKWKDLTNLNYHSIGIELANFGKLHKVGDHYNTWFNKRVHPREVFTYIDPWTGNEQYYHKYTPAQLNRTLEVVKLLKKKYGIKWVLGHSDISAKLDPGPGFPMQDFQHINN